MATKKRIRLSKAARAEWFAFGVKAVEEARQERARLEKKRGKVALVHFIHKGVTLCGHRSATSGVTSEPQQVTCTLCKAVIARHRP